MLWGTEGVIIIRIPECVCNGMVWGCVTNILLHVLRVLCTSCAYVLSCRRHIYALCMWHIPAGRISISSLCHHHRMEMNVYMWLAQLEGALADEYSVSSGRRRRRRASRTPLKCVLCTSIYTSCVVSCNWLAWVVRSLPATVDPKTSIWYVWGVSVCVRFSQNKMDIICISSVCVCVWVGPVSDDISAVWSACIFLLKPIEYDITCMGAGIFFFPWNSSASALHGMSLLHACMHGGYTWWKLV